ncbi:Asp-tRNA(Asn)/Glu-tRNA(Gln) amidotransferase subunit GatC [Candidatus Peregrinibacteria bacterium]|nr:MAG: Asp-tRNA(Asn)/Glu-tRNA(Gln) amidotransferase subunit GatC [Candidatus Peregrinibacteria bacterium]
MLTKDDVQKIAHLARLQLTDLEIEKFAMQLNGILEYAEKLKEVNTDHVEPISQVTGLENQNQADQIDICKTHLILLSKRLNPCIKT